MFTRLKRWGNSFAVRIPKDEVDRLRAHEGDVVRIELTRVPDTIDVASIPVFHDPDGLSVDELRRRRAADHARR